MMNSNEKETLMNYLYNKENISIVVAFDDEAGERSNELKDEGYDIQESIRLLNEKENETTLVITKGFTIPSDYWIIDFYMGDPREPPKQEKPYSYLALYYRYTEALKELDDEYLEEEINPILYEIRSNYFHFVKQLDLEGMAVLGEL